MLHLVSKLARRTASVERAREATSPTAGGNISAWDAYRVPLCIPVSMLVLDSITRGMMNLHVWRCHIRAHPTLKRGYKGVFDNLCRIHSAYAWKVVSICLLQRPTQANTYCAYRTLRVTFYAWYVPPTVSIICRLWDVTHGVSSDTRHRSRPMSDTICRTYVFDGIAPYHARPTCIT